MSHSVRFELTLPRRGDKEAILYPRLSEGCPFQGHGGLAISIDVDQLGVEWSRSAVEAIAERLREPIEFEAEP